MIILNAGRTGGFRHAMRFRQFLPQRKAEVVIAALSMSAIAETEHACPSYGTKEMLIVASS
jgi:hypothetical protein